jgi:hypothetical protein
MENKYVLFLDNISRTILGVLVEQTEYTVSVKNPTILQIAQGPQNSLNVQVVPLVFRDMLKNPNDDIIWNYSRADITTPQSPVDLSEKLIRQYEFVANLTPEKAAVLRAQSQAAKPATAATPVKLFGGEGK